MMIAIYVKSMDTTYRAIMTIVSEETPYPQLTQELHHYCAALLSIGNKAQINIGAHKSPRKFIAMRA